MFRKWKYRYRKWKAWKHYSRWNWFQKLLVLFGLKQSTWFETFIAYDDYIGSEFIKWTGRTKQE